MIWPPGGGGGSRAAYAPAWTAAVKVGKNGGNMYNIRKKRIYLARLIVPWSNSTPPIHPNILPRICELGPTFLPPACPSVVRACLRGGRRGLPKEGAGEICLHPVANWREKRGGGKEMEERKR